MRDFYERYFGFSDTLLFATDFLFRFNLCIVVGVIILTFYFQFFAFSHTICVTCIAAYSVVIERNRRFDAAALQQRNVIIQRRLSELRVQQPPSSQQTRRLSMGILSISGQQTTSNVNIGASSPSIDDSHSGGIQAEDSQPSSSQSINDAQQTNVHQPTSNSNDGTGSSQIDVQQTNSDENVSPNVDSAKKTAFPGHIQKKGRKSFFDRSEMDRYMLKFQPTQAAPVSSAPRRRHSMVQSRPPISRMNRFSLDSIPEAISEVRHINRSENNANVSRNSRAGNEFGIGGSSENKDESIGSGMNASNAIQSPSITISTEKNEPMFKRIIMANSEIDPDFINQFTSVRQLNLHFI